MKIAEILLPPFGPPVGVGEVPEAVCRWRPLSFTFALLRRAGAEHEERCFWHPRRRARRSGRLTYNPPGWVYRVNSTGFPARLPDTETIPPSRKSARGLEAPRWDNEIANCERGVVVPLWPLDYAIGWSESRWEAACPIWGTQKGEHGESTRPRSGHEDNLNDARRQETASCNTANLSLSGSCTREGSPSDRAPAKGASGQAASRAPWRGLQERSALRRSFFVHPVEKAIAWVRPFALTGLPAR